MFCIQTKFIFITSALLTTLGFCLITFTGLSAVLSNYPGISFVLGTLLLTAIILTLGKNDASDSVTPSSNNGELATLYVGNLPYKVNEKEVKMHFEQFGYVQSVRLMKDKRTGKRKGFGFVEISDGDQHKIIDALNDTTFHERTLKVRQAKDKVES